MVLKFSQYMSIIKKLQLECSIKNNTMMKYGGTEVQLHAFVTLELEGGE